jgi:tripartite-type tricarboxylate transporter receptor subunit TctC
LPGMGDRLAVIELTHSTPEELGEFIRSETERWGPVIKKLGLKGE